MKVKDLITRLQDFDLNRNIIVSSDEEGNSFSELHFVEEEFATINDYEISVHHPTDVQYMDEEDLKNIQKVIVIWP